MEHWRLVAGEQRLGLGATVGRGARRGAELTGGVDMQRPVALAHAVATGGADVSAGAAAGLVALVFDGWKMQVAEGTDERCYGMG